VKQEKSCKNVIRIMMKSFCCCCLQENPENKKKKEAQGRLIMVTSNEKNVLSELIFV
jgi:hypothetical protein